MPALRRYAGGGLIALAVVCGVALLVALAISGGRIGAPVAIVIAALIIALAYFGPERTGLGLLGLSFVTAPFYKGLPALISVATPTDILFVMAVGLLLPRLLAGKAHFSPGFMLPPIVIGISGLAGSIGSGAAATSVTVLFQWLICIVGYPVILARLDLSRTAINRLAWAFVGGHMISILYGFAKGPIGDGGRYEGLTQHPNAFAQSGMLAFALLLYLQSTAKNRWIVWAAMAACLLSIYISGSRGGTLAVAFLIMLIPIVERSALAGYLVSLVGVAGAVTVTLLISNGDAGGSLTRLAGGGSASSSDTIRLETLTTGMDRFYSHPLVGTGFLDLGPIHNNFVEVAASIGIFGFAAYVVYLLVNVRCLFTTGPMRRLAYPLAGFIVFGATVPSLTDRSIWLSVGLGLAVFRGFNDAQGSIGEMSDEPDDGADEEPPPPRHALTPYRRPALR